MEDQGQKETSILLCKDCATLNEVMVLCSLCKIQIIKVECQENKCPMLKRTMHF